MERGQPDEVRGGAAAEQPEHGGKLFPRRRGWWRANLLGGVLLLATIVFIARHVGDERRFALLVRSARPAWLLAAVAAQVITYVCSAGVWHRTIARHGTAPRLRRLVPLGFAKMLVDQVVPAAGVGGAVVVVRGLVRRGVAPPLATASLLMDLVSFYAGHGTAVVLAVATLWLRGDRQPAVLAGSAFFLAVAACVPAAILLLQRFGPAGAPRSLRRVPGVGALLDTLARTSGAALRDGPLVLQAALLQFTDVVLDATTLALCLRALGQPAPLEVVFPAYTLASAIASLGLVPGGVGVFEAASVAMLRLLRVPLEAGLAATLLARGLTLWLPLIPGLWIARREARAEARGGQRAPGTASAG